MKRQKEEVDRLSDLSDCVLLHILSFLDAKYVVQTCILSTRWKNLWKHLPTLILTSLNSENFEGFTKFVSRILSLRDTSMALHTLDFNPSDIVEPNLLNMVVNYAVSHNIQRLYMCVLCDIQHLPSPIFSCQTLVSLDLFVLPMRTKNILYPNSLNLPALTCLHIGSVAFRGGSEPFSACHRLSKLVMYDFEVLDEQNLYISSVTLSNLSIFNPWKCSKIELSTPNLCNFNFIGIPVQILYGCKSNLSIEHVSIHIPPRLNSVNTSLVLLHWLIELPNIKSLKVSSNTLQILDLARDSLKVELPLLSNLKSLKIKKRHQSARIPYGIVNFLIQNSPSAKVEITS